MPADSAAKKAPDVKDVFTRYEVCRLDGTDSRMFPDGTKLQDAKAGCELLNKQCALGKTEPSQAHPDGQVLNAHIANHPTPVRHVGMGGSGIHLPDTEIDVPGHGKHTIQGGELCRVAEYEVRTHIVEVQS